MAVCEFESNTWFSAGTREVVARDASLLDEVAELRLLESFVYYWLSIGFLETVHGVVFGFDVNSRDATQLEDISERLERCIFVTPARGHERHHDTFARHA